MFILHPLLSWKDEMSHSPAMLLGNLILDLLGPKLVAWVKCCHKLQHLLWIMQAGQLPLTTWFSISVQLIMEWDILLLLLQMLLSTVSTSLSLTETYYHGNSYCSKTWVLSHSKSSQHSHKCTDPSWDQATLGPIDKLNCIVCRGDWLWNMKPRCCSCYSELSDCVKVFGCGLIGHFCWPVRSKQPMKRHIAKPSDGPNNYCSLLTAE